jgi:hypothetical protein
MTNMVRLVSNASSIEYDAACAFEYNAFTVYCSRLVLRAKRRCTLEVVCREEGEALVG